MASYLTLLSNLRSKKSQAKAARKKYEARKKAVKSILKDLQGDFDNNVEAVNKKKTRVQEESASGFYNLSNIVSQNSEIGAVVELYPETDKNLLSAIENLNSEISKLDERIEQIDQMISELSELSSEVTQAMLAGEDISIATASGAEAYLSFNCNW